MKIAVLSDTHIPTVALNLPEKLMKAIHGVNMILHAGDICSHDLLIELSTIAPVKAVAGNMDTATLGHILPKKLTLNLEGHKIGLIHGFGPPDGMVNRIKKEFNKVSCVVFGHTHQPMNKLVDKVLFFNPGSSTDKRFAEHNTFGMLEVTADSVKGSIINL